MSGVRRDQAMRGSARGGRAGRAVRARGRTAAWGAAALGLLSGEAALVVPARAATPPIQVRATVDPAVARLGQRVIYRGRAIFAFDGPPVVKWLPPELDSSFTWGKLSARRVPGRRVERVGAAQRRPPPFQWYDTLFVEAPLQVFRLGTVSIPGLRFQDQDPIRSSTQRLPSVRLIVVPVLTAADSNADLRPVRGPLAAPWWERVPWIWVGAGAAAIAALAWAIRRWRRRKPAAPAEAPAVQDPAAQALAALASLRRLGLPAQARFAEHAFHLSRIVRRFLEATAGTPPGDTTPELLLHLQGARLGPEDFRLLEGLLRSWDRVKFARAPSSVEEAARAEQAVESLVRRRGPAPAERKVA